MRTILLAGVTAAIALVGSPGSIAAEPRYDVCRTEIIEAVRGRFGQTVTDLDLFFWHAAGDDESDIEYGTAIVETDGCAGYHVYQVYADEFQCLQAHYGEPPSYAVYLTSEKGC